MTGNIANLVVLDVLELMRRIVGAHYGNRQSLGEERGYRSPHLKVKEGIHCERESMPKIVGRDVYELDGQAVDTVVSKSPATTAETTIVAVLRR